MSGEFDDSETRGEMMVWEERNEHLTAILGILERLKEHRDWIERESKPEPTGYAVERSKEIDQLYVESCIAVFKLLMNRLIDDSPLKDSPDRENPPTDDIGSLIEACKMIRDESDMRYGVDRVEIARCAIEEMLSELAKFE